MLAARCMNIELRWCWCGCDADLFVGKGLACLPQPCRCGSKLVRSTTSTIFSITCSLAHALPDMWCMCVGRHWSMPQTSRPAGDWATASAACLRCAWQRTITLDFMNVAPIPHHSLPLLNLTAPSPLASCLCKPDILLAAAVVLPLAGSTAGSAPRKVGGRCTCQEMVICTM